jgi:hypothetical protein
MTARNKSSRLNRVVDRTQIGQIKQRQDGDRQRHHCRAERMPLGASAVGVPGALCGQRLGGRAELPGSGTVDRMIVCTRRCWCGVPHRSTRGGRAALDRRRYQLTLRRRHEHLAPRPADGFPAESARWLPLVRRDGGDDRDDRGDEGEQGDRRAGPGEGAGVLRGRSRVLLGVHRTGQDRAQQLVLLVERLMQLSDFVGRGCGAGVAGRGLGRSREVTGNLCAGLRAGLCGRRRAAVQGAKEPADVVGALPRHNPSGAREQPGGQMPLGRRPGQAAVGRMLCSIGFGVVGHTPATAALHGLLPTPVAGDRRC